MIRSWQSISKRRSRSYAGTCLTMLTVDSRRMQHPWMCVRNTDRSSMHSTSLSTYWSTCTLSNLLIFQRVCKEMSSPKNGFCLLWSWVHSAESMEACALGHSRLCVTRQSPNVCMDCKHLPESIRNDPASTGSREGAQHAWAGFTDTLEGAWSDEDGAARSLNLCSSVISDWWLRLKALSVCIFWSYTGKNGYGGEKEGRGTCCFQFSF